MNTYFSKKYVFDCFASTALNPCAVEKKVLRRRLIKLCLVGLLFAMNCPAFSFADPVNMSILPNGNGSFVLVGENVNGVQSLDIEIAYDSSLLENPTMQITGGNLSQVNSDSPGNLVASISRPVANGILQIVLNFQTKTDTAGGIYTVSANATSMAPQPSQLDSDSTSSSDNTGDGSVNGSENGPSVASSAIEVGETAPKVTQTIVSDSNNMTNTLSAQAGMTSPAGTDQKIHKEETASIIYDETSVLQRFKKFEGRKGLKTFAALFKRRDGDRSAQEPAIAISDGKTPVTIRMEVQKEESYPIGIALANGILISKEVSEKGIVMTVLPNEGTWDVRLAIDTGREFLDYPLVVSPPIKLDDGVDENNFLDELQEYINKQSSALHRDNKIYFLEYIFTANYLANLNRKTQ